jgi:transcription elongation factor Elf1
MLLFMGLMVDLSAPIDVYSDWIDAAEAVGRTGGIGGDEDEYEEDEDVEV